MDRTNKKTCPKCAQQEGQNKQGFSGSGSQRYFCKFCGCKYVPVKKNRGYPPEVRLQAMKLMLDGMSGRAIGRQLGISKANAYNWAKKNRDGVDK
jgi:transposase-like protein